MRLLDVGEVIADVRPRLLAQAVGLVGERDAEDLVQAALVRWLVAGAPCSGSSRLAAYLSIAMRSVVRDRHRRTRDPLDLYPLSFSASGEPWSSGGALGGQSPSPAR